MDLGHFQRFLQGKRRQDAGDPVGNHGLAAAGRPDHQQVVDAMQRLSSSWRRFCFNLMKEVNKMRKNADKALRITTRSSGKILIDGE